jgi:glycosyltransferase involved in cell wall biosynthesis
MTEVSGATPMDQAAPTISAVIITKDEARNILDCLASVAFCDEVIVVDSGSTDGTVEMARSRGAKVVHRDFAGFGPQFNYAASLATCDWVLSVDADERITPELVAEIKRAVAYGRADGYELSRLSSFCGRQMRHSGWYPDYVLRLWKRGRARWNDVLVHPRPRCDGSVERLSGHLIHHAVLRLEDTLSRMDRYSTAGAQQMTADGRRVTFFSGIGRGAWTFLRTYILRGGFLDGREGFMLAVANAEGTYYRYMKAWLMQRDKTGARR